jgi:hypothetical protein
MCTIDVRDLARFTRTVIENDLAGHLTSLGRDYGDGVHEDPAHRTSFGCCRFIKSAGVTEFELPSSDPNAARSGLMDVSNERARLRVSH